MTTSSNVVTVTVAGAAAEIAISVSPTSLPSTGGTVTVSGTTNLADGTTVDLFVNGTNVASTTTAGGAFSFTYDVAANSGTSPVTDSLQVST